jgi:TPR repeat protein
MLFRKALICAALVGASLPAARSQTSAKSGTVPTPDKMRFCAYFCFVLTRQGDHYNAVDDGSVNGPVKSIYRITALTPGSVVINRTDMGGGTAILRGHLSADGESVEDGKAEYHGKDGSISRYPFQLAWGNSIGRPVAINSSSTPSTAQARQGTSGSAPQGGGSVQGKPSAQACQAAQNDVLERVSAAPQSVNRQLALTPNPYAKTASGRFNLNGIWTFGDCGKINGQVTITRFRVKQDGDTITAVAETPGWEHDKDILFKAKYTGLNEIEGMTALNEKAATPVWTLKPQKIVIFGPDRIKLGPSGVSLLRLSLTGIYDAKCDEHNLQNIEGPSALFRGEEAAYFAGDYRLAACWLKVGAQQEEPASEGLLASLYYQGLGVPQNYAEAFKWASKSAAQGNDFGEDQLSLIYATGNGAEANSAVARYWFQRARTQPRSIIDLSWGPKTLFGVDRTTSLIAAGGIPFYLQKPEQRNRPSEPVADCTVKGSAQLSSEVQWKNSQIAFGERNFPASACWALYASIQGNTKAKMALAWFFDDGVGVDRHAAATTMWYADAAKEDDAYAEAYMAAYSLFVELNLDKSEQFQRRVKAHPMGEALLKGVTADFQSKLKPETDTKPQQFEIRLSGTFGDFAHSMHRDSVMQDAYRDAYRWNGGNPDRAREAAERAGKQDEAEESFIGGMLSIGRDDQQQGQADNKANAEVHDQWVQKEFETEARMIKAHLNQQH